jgi:SAM-dependent methyltransferase
VDRTTLARAYDGSAESYDDRFRTLQREKYRAAAGLLARPLPAGDILDAGGGTALFSEWLADASEPHPDLRAALQRRRLVVLDASLGMLGRAHIRTPLCVAGDLAAPPLQPRSFALVLAFTSVLEEPARGLRALGALLVPDGLLLATFLEAEVPAAEDTFAKAGLDRIADAEAGQDRAFLLHRR